MSRIKHSILFLSVFIFLIAMKGMTQCADNYGVTGGALQLTWSSGTRPSGVASIDFDGANYTGSNLGGNKWKTDAASFVNGADDAGNHSIVLRDGANNNLSGGTCQYTDGSFAGVLPVELTRFSAQIYKEVVIVEWETVSETNNSYFVVERSREGSLFYSIGSRKGAGTSNIPIAYSWMDERPLSGISYYRLKQVDFNGASSFSNVVSVEVKRNRQKGLVVYPNPADGKSIVIQLDDFDGEEAYVVIYNTVGQIMAAKRLTAQRVIYFTPDIPLMNGVYWLHVMGKARRLKTKIMVSN